LANWKDIGTATTTASSATAARKTGFPYATTANFAVGLKAPYVPPTVSRSTWWEPTLCGFLGFSYPIEGAACPDSASLIKEFTSMRDDFGASLVRIYAPECREETLWKSLIDAAVSTNMGLILQIWWGFGDDQNAWTKSVASLKNVLASADYGPIAPYVVHSISFGSEPIGDGVNGGAAGFTKDLETFRESMMQYGIPVGISEDWDRPGIMSSADGKTLGDVGKGVLNSSDVVHAHIMPYYHFLNQSASWAYVKDQLAWYNANIPSKVPVFVSQSMWAWAYNEGHGGGENDVGMPQYQGYWRAFDDNCETFKANNVGWFIHTWHGEGVFDMAPSGAGAGYSMQGWKPRKC
jgi:hypothetical protein